MRNYQLGKIYMIEPTCEYEEGDVYYGSTIQEYLSTRLAGHKSSYHNWLNVKSNMLTSFSLFEKYGRENCKITLVESYPCETKYELESRESFYIRENKCVNKFIPTRSNKQYLQDNADKIKEYKKEHYQDNADKIKEQHKKYQQGNADKIKEYHKQYHQSNIDRKKEYKKQYRQDNADKLKQYRQDNADKLRERTKQYRLKKKLEKLKVESVGLMECSS